MTELLNFINDCSKEIKDDLKDFSKRLNENPYNTLSWSQNTFHQVALLSVLNKVKNSITKEDSRVNKESLVKYCEQRVLNMSNDVEKSSSLTGNLMDRMTLKAWSQVLHAIKTEDYELLL